MRLFPTTNCPAAAVALLLLLLAQTSLEQEGGGASAEASEAPSEASPPSEAGLERSPLEVDFNVSENEIPDAPLFDKAPVRNRIVPLEE